MVIMKEKFNEDLMHHPLEEWRLYDSSSVLDLIIVTISSSSLPMNLKQNLQHVLVSGI